MQCARVQTHKQRPLSPVVKEKLDRSLMESRELTERELYCPYCGWYINTLYSDCSGHFKAKCHNCKEITVFNLSYFRRVKRYREYNLRRKSRRFYR